MIINGRPGGYGRDEEGRKGRTGKVRGVGWGGGQGHGGKVYVDINSD